MRPYFLSLLLVVSILLKGKTQPPAIPGWKMETNTGTYVYTPLNATKNEFVYTLQPLRKENPDDLASWLEQLVKADLSKNNLTSVKAPSIRQINTVSSYAVTVKPPSGSQRILTYFAYRVPDNAIRVAILSSVDGNAISYYTDATKHLASLIKSESRPGAGTGAGTTAGTGTGATAGTSTGMNKDKSPQQQPSTTTSPKPIPDQGPTTGKFNNSNNIRGIVLHRETKWAGGLAAPSYEPYLLLKDGSVYMYIKDDPTSLDIVRSKQTDYKNWGTWKMEGTTIILSYVNNKGTQTETWTKAWWNWAEPAARGEKIVGSFSAISIGGTGIGGTFSAVSRNLSFNSSGQFSQEGSVAATANGGGGTTGAYATSHNAGTYFIDGFSIEFRFNDGKTSRKCFYFYDSDKDLFGIGGSVYTKDSK